MKFSYVRSLLVFWSMTLFVSVSWAQTTVTKEVKKQAKSMKKEGWKVNDSDKSIELQLADLQRYTSDDDYIVESASQISKSYHLGYTSARAKALRALSLRLSTLITSDTEIAQTNVQKEDGEAESQVALNARIKSVSQETLSNAFPVLVLSRQLPDGTCEVQVHLAIEVDEIND
jgi:hypothetical protein